MRNSGNGFFIFLGGRPIPVIVKLLLISLLVGFVMAVFNLQPLEIVQSGVRFIVDVWETGFAAFGEFGRYVLAGATLVVPIWLVMRLLAYRRDRNGDPHDDVNG